jgi:hypothetical protein
LVFISNTVPIDDIGSFVIFRRHLEPLVRQGWELTVITDVPAPPPAQVFWQHIQLVRRRRWWPPVRQSFLPSVILRTHLQAQALKSLLPAKETRTILLTNLWDDLSLLAVHYGRCRNWPLGVFLHDDEILWHGRDAPQSYLRWKRKIVCSAANKIWSVSESLVEQLDDSVQPRCKILRPIPGVFSSPRAEWRTDFEKGPRIGYAGKTYGAFQTFLLSLARLLQACGGTLNLLTDAENVRILHQSEPNLYAQPFLPTSAEASDWLNNNCSALLIAHPLSFAGVSRQWEILRTSFPSKLPEGAQLGLPLILISAEDSTFGRWARSKPDAPFFSRLDDPNLARYLASLRERSTWEASARWTRDLAAGEFSPQRIQGAFEEDIGELSRSAHSRPGLRETRD